MRGMPKLAAAFLAAVLAALTLAACGGGSSTDESSSKPSSTEAPPATTGKSAAAKGDEGQKSEGGEAAKPQQPKGSSGESGSPGGTAAVPPLKVSGGGSAQFKTSGGDNSVQEFGDEDESELQQAAETVHGFYVARAEEDWATACSYMTKSVVKQFEELAARTPQLKGKGCPEVLHAFTRPLPAAVERETTYVDAASLRREGERGFLIYKGADGKPYTMPMVFEDGSWKVGSLAGTPLSA